MDILQLPLRDAHEVRHPVPVTNVSQLQRILTVTTVHQGIQLHVRMDILQRLARDAHAARHPEPVTNVSQLQRIHIATLVRPATRAAVVVQVIGKLVLPARNVLADQRQEPVINVKK